MYYSIKRILDVVFSLLLIGVVLLPLLPIMLWLRMSGEGEVFYRQKRIGYHNKYFWVWKFATMLKASPQMGTGSLTLRNDPRVTGPGRFLRKTKINELPQLINVLMGEMSFVGPRPQMQEDFEVYSPDVREKIYKVKPGITGLGSIIFRDEESLLSKSGIEPKEFYAIHIAPYKGAVELWYNEHATLAIDFKILVLTAWVILFPDSKIWKKTFKGLPNPPREIMCS